MWGRKARIGTNHIPCSVISYPSASLHIILLSVRPFNLRGGHLVSKPRTEIEYLRKSAAYFEHGKQLDAGQRNAGIKQAIPISIDSNVWRAANVVVLPGVTIGDGAVVEAGSVMTRDVAPFTLVAGNPARLIRSIGGENQAGGE